MPTATKNGTTKKKSRLNGLGGAVPTNDAAEMIMDEAPYMATFTIKGRCPILFHRYSVEAVEEQQKGDKGSKKRKQDQPELYVYRNNKGQIVIPSLYMQRCLVEMGKFRQDPRSKRKSCHDLYEAIILQSPEVAYPVGTVAGQTAKTWDYLDKQRAIVQGNAVNRCRPAFHKGWTCRFDLVVQLPGYLSPENLHKLVSDAGMLVGIGDYRPSYGRFQVVDFETTARIPDYF